MFLLSEDFQAKPTFLLKYGLGGPTSLDLNAFLMIEDFIWLDCSYQTGVKLYDKNYSQHDLTSWNAVVGAVQIFLSEKLRIGLWYGFSIDPLEGNNSGKHEIFFPYRSLNQRSD
ncbi:MULTISPECIES: type IX secretion system membrane protein PorP/SprF [unclassified Pedobacter]|uniref:type IX secretion system membrane protein PorP/SprF n=1 Tax=unclassified Pedobacter TaxID=2628915 RepID=UPI00141E724F|nr:MULTISPECIES: type IX secretion system membrane protein PorP/SprF [unclassified Pedobacter]NII82315.1 hypothetical protein [Pedobacter sp. SG908]NMN36339.1 hypothetical protein [Pedobacter sp. SG918]